MAGLITGIVCLMIFGERSFILPALPGYVRIAGRLEYEREEENKIAQFYFLAVSASAVITFLFRALPFLLFHGDRKMPEWLARLGSVLPSAIMAVLIVYCLRGAKCDVTHTGVPGLIAVLLTAVIYRWKHQTLLSIFFGTAVYMMLIRVIA